MQFDVLGPLRVVGANGSPVAMNSVAQRRLMSILVCRAGAVVSADFLSEHLDLTPGALRTSVSRMRRIVGFDTLVTAPPGYQLRSEDIDARRFEQLVADARDAGDPAAVRTMLGEALALWRGDAYGEFAHEIWASAESRRLTELRLGAIEDLAELLLDAGEWTAAIAILEPLIDEEPFRDRPRGLLMRALADSGRRTDALRAFQAYRSYLLDEVGTEPSEAIASLDRQIARGNGDEIPADLPGVFLMTDIVGSTRLWAEDPEAMGADLALHDDVVSHAIGEHGGVVISTAGDSFVGAFAAAGDAVAAAIAAQETLATSAWRLDAGLRVRMGIHLGSAQRRGDGWYGPPLNETARITAVAHGGQVVVSEAAVTLLPDLKLVDLGEHRLRDLDGTRRLFQLVAPGLVDEFPPLRSMGSFVTTLPAQRTTLIGRDDLIGEIRKKLLAHRLVSLIGPGGVGKTRAAIEASAQELGSFPGGVFFVDLTTTNDRADVLAAVVSGVRATVPPERPVDEHLAEQLSDPPALLVMDNCEHVIEAASAVVDDLLNAAPDLRVLATSREPLQIYGENRLLMPSLDVDGPASAGVLLFTERALAADSTFVADDSALETVAEIVRRLDGIPLAIELAAAQVRASSPERILAQLDDRFRFLRQGSRQAPQRQKTLERAVAWSYDLLDPDEQHAFDWLSVCAGTFTLATAASMLGLDELNAADRLDALVGKSLVTQVRVGGQTNGYSYLETLRAFGRAKLAEAGTLTDAISALESALLPSPALLDDWTALVNDYICASSLDILLEDATRRDAATRALEAGRLNSAALIFSSCVFYDDPGANETALHRVAPLAARRDELDPTAWRAAVAAKVGLETRTRRFGDTLQTAVDMLAALDDEDPARGWFDCWRCALTMAVAPQAGITEIDTVLPRELSAARRQLDYTLSQFLAMKATGLALLRRLDEARPIAEEALARAPAGRESRDQALALLLWIIYLAGGSCDEALQAEVAAQHQELGLAELCAAPAALCATLSVEERAIRLVASARRRPANDVATPYLLAFAWLAVEDGDHERAAELAACSEIYEASTQLALFHLLSVLDGWPDETWDAERDHALGRYLSPDHEPAVKAGFGTLAAELDRWERRLADR